MTTLYKKSRNGQMRFWSIEQEDNFLVKTFGVIGGEEVEHVEEVFGNSLRDDYEQAEARMEAKIKKRMENGFKETIEEAQTADIGMNQLGFTKPMLAARYDKVKDADPNNSYFQYKYDGHRCLIVNDGGIIKAYSRNGKPIESITEILGNIDVPEGVTIDGELYCHGQKLQTISSWIKRRQENTKKLRFICYDAVIDEDYTERLALISSLKLGDRAEVAPVLEYEGAVKPMLNDAIGKGYEGLIMRAADGFEYKRGKRSKGLIKIKQFFDDEFVVVDVHPSRDNWAILTCMMHNGKKFRVSAPGNIREKKFVLNNATLFIGKSVTVEYSMFTKDEIPFHPVATQWRDKGSE